MLPTQSYEAFFNLRSVKPKLRQAHRCSETSTTSTNDDGIEGMINNRVLILSGKTSGPPSSACSFE